jgi:hypothetical protein
MMQRLWIRLLLAVQYCILALAEHMGRVIEDAEDILNEATS